MSSLDEDSFGWTTTSNDSVSSLDEDSFGWTTASNDSDIMHSDDDNHNSTRKKPRKRKIKEKDPNDSTIETLENEEIKKSVHGSPSPSILIKNETEANVTPSSVIKKNIKNKSLSNTLVYNNEVSSDVSELNISKKKAKKHKKCTMWDDIQLNETSEIDNQRITTDPELSAISKNFDIRVKGESLVMNIEKKSKKRSKSEKLINRDLKTDEENLNHAEPSLESFENTEDAAEELREKKFEKQSKKMLKHNLKKSVTVFSDEIPFEDQVTENGRKSSVQKLKDSKLLSQYILKNKNLKPMKSKLAGDSFLTEDDDIWIMKCPIEINIKSLYESDLIVDNKCKLKINNQVYQGILNNSKINVAMPYVDGEKFIVKNCLPKGVVRLRKRIPKPHFVQDAVLDMNAHSIPLPETKLRHPLFGFDYKSYVELPSYVTEKLQNVELTSVENHNVKKKNKRKKIEIEMEPVRKSKKRKFSGESDTTVVKTKKKKQKSNTEEIWESEKAIEEHLFNL